MDREGEGWRRLEFDDDWIDIDDQRLGALALTCRIPERRNLVSRFSALWNIRAV